jgi:hypothetical protein
MSSEMRLQPFDFVRAMLATLKLVVPALLPSWRFFAYVGPSPRIEYACLSDLAATPGTWRELRPRPEKISLGAMLRHLFWNPDWNESLYLVTCCERFLADLGEHWRTEIMHRVLQTVGSNASNLGSTPARYAIFRIVLIERRGAVLVTEVVYVSPPASVALDDR